MIKRVTTGVVVLIIAYTIILNWQLIQTLNNLSNVTLENIHIDGKEFTLNKGGIYENGKQIFWFLPHHKQVASKLIGLSGFYMWNKEDPLLTSPGFNTDGFERSIKLLEEQDKRFQEDISLRYNIFPIQFLYSLLDIKQATDTFLQNPNQENAEKLLQIQYQTVKHYRQDIEQRILLLEENIKDNNKNVNIMYLGVATTPQIILNSYKALLDNAGSLEDEISKREKCLRGAGQCIRPFKNFSKLMASKTPANNSSILDDNILFSDPESIRPLRKGPFSVPTACLGLNEKLGEQKQKYYLVQKVLERYPIMEGYEILQATPANEKYFRSVRNVLTKDRITQQLGLSWSVQVTTQTYNCPELAYLAKLATMNSYLKRLEEQSLFKDISYTGKADVDKIITLGKELENQFITSELKDYETFEELGNLYLKFYYQVYSDRGLNDLQRQADIFLEYGLGMQRLFADIHLKFNRMTSEFIALSLHEVLDKIEAGNLYLYGIRNIPTLTYFTFSKSVFRSGNKPKYYQNKIVENIGFDKPYLTYTLALTKYPKEEVLSWSHNPDSVLLEVYNIYLNYKKAREGL